MNILLPELFYKICDDTTRITDVRNLSRVCVNYNKSCKKRICELEELYIQKHTTLLFAKYLKAGGIEKYTIEIILDDCYNLLPEKYYNIANTIICPMFAFMGRLDLLKSKLAKLCPLTTDVIRCAAYSGHVDIIQFGMDNMQHFSISSECSNICVNAGYSGNVNVLEWMKENNYDININEVCKYAMIQGHLHIYKWLFENTCFVGRNLHIDVSKYGHVHILQWAYDNSIFMDNDFCGMAIAWGHPNVLQWALEHNYNINNLEWNRAAANGHVNVLQWLKNHNYSFDQSLLRIATVNGKLDVLKWAIDNNYKLHDTFYVDAIVHDYLDIIQWAFYIGHQMTKSDVKTAFVIRNNHVLSWLIKNDLIKGNKTIEYSEFEKTNVYLIVNLEEMQLYVDIFTLKIDTIQFIIEKYCTFKKQYNFIIDNGHITVKKYGDDNNCNKQKIVCVEKNKSIVSYLNCDNNCWMYFLTLCRGNYLNINIFAREKISECCQHKIYINKF